MRHLVEIRSVVKDEKPFKTKPSGIAVLLKEGVTLKEAREIVDKVMPKAIDLCGAGNDGEILGMIREELSKIGDIYHPSVIAIRT